MAKVEYLDYFLISLTPSADFNILVSRLTFLILGNCHETIDCIWLGEI